MRADFINAGPNRWLSPSHFFIIFLYVTVMEVHSCLEVWNHWSKIVILILVLLSQVPITFLPRDRGDYAQFWDLECHPVSEPQQKSRVRFQLCGTVRTLLLPPTKMIFVLFLFVRISQKFSG